MNSAAGGGRKSEKDEDMYDKSTYLPSVSFSRIILFPNLRVQKQKTNIVKELISSKKSSSIKDLKTTSLLWSKPRTRKSTTSSGANIRRRREVISLSRTSLRDSVEVTRSWEGVLWLVWALGNVVTKL